jgi:hypothetical protein
MIHRYNIITQKKEKVTVSDGTTPISFNNCNAKWVVDLEDKLEKVVLDVSGCPIKKDDRGAILSSYPEIDAMAYNFAAYLANYIFIETGIDPFDPFSILSGSPELVAENEREEEEIQASKITAHSNFDGKCRILRKFEPTKCESNYERAIAIGHFADALRSNNPFQKFECFFKVVESILDKGRNESAKSFDYRVSGYAVLFDPQFTQDVIKNLRQIRNYCVHPDNPGHLSRLLKNSFYT